MSEPPLLAVRHLDAFYGDFQALFDLSVDVQAGEAVAVVGANGAGKSTLMRLATGQLRPDLGKVEILGHAAHTAAARRHVGYCPDADAFYEEMSGRQFVETMARLCGYSRRQSQERTAWVLELVGMGAYATRPCGEPTVSA